MRISIDPKNKSYVENAHKKFKIRVDGKVISEWDLVDDDMGLVEYMHTSYNWDYSSTTTRKKMYGVVRINRK